MRLIFRYKWSLLSGLITAIHCAIIIGVVEYLYRQGRWHPDLYPRPQIIITLADVHGLGILLSAAAAVRGMMVERPLAYAAVALGFSLFSYVIYVG
jgi:hypothetical protein